MLSSTTDIRDKSILDILPMEALFMIISNIKDDTTLLSLMLSCKSFASIVASNTIQKRLGNRPKNYQGNARSVMIPNASGFMRLRQNIFSANDDTILVPGCKSILIYSLAMPGSVKEIKFEKERCSPDAEYSPDGSKLLARGCHALYVLNSETGELEHTYEHPFISLPLTVSSDGNYVVTSSSEEANCWDITTGKLINSFSDSGIINTIMSPDKQFIITTSASINPTRTDIYDISVKIWSIETGALLHDLKKSSHMQTCGISFSSNSELVAIGAGNKIDVHSPKTGEVAYTLADNDTTSGSVHFSLVCFSPKGSHIVSNHKNNNEIIIWDLASKASRQISIGTSGLIYHIDFQPYSNNIMAISGDGSLRIINLATFKTVYSHSLVTKNNGNYAAPQAAFSRHGNIAFKDLNGLYILDFPMHCHQFSLNLFFGSVSQKKSHKNDDGHEMRIQKKCVLQ
jgi:WD40 repeat protein